MKGILGVSNVLCFGGLQDRRIIGLQGAPRAQIILNVSLSDEISKSEIFALSAPLRLKQFKERWTVGHKLHFF